MRARRYSYWALMPPFDPTRGARNWGESASIDLLMEGIRRHAEIAAVGRARFSGNLATKNALWRPYRNYLRQALSNYSAATGVPNRSACLLYYYAMLNFAKAELLDVHASRLVDKRIVHGLSFNPTRARTVKGDALVVHEGVFPLLYERRTGMNIRVGTRLPVRRLLANIPEISSQLRDTGAGATSTAGILQLVAWDDSDGWILLLITPDNVLHGKSVTKSLLHRHFHEIDAPEEWRDHFGVSRRWNMRPIFYESNETVPRGHSGWIAPYGPVAISWKLRDILGLRTNEQFDATLAPYLYKTRKLPMPPALARYAVTYYASSLVRYKPQMFDSQLYPEYAYLFDAIARECALPMLIDTLSALENCDQLFFSSGSLRV